MANAIKFGDKSVPIVENFTSQSSISQGWKPSASDFTDTLESYFERGVEVGSGDWNLQPANLNYLHDGNTPLNNGGNLKVQISSSPKTYGADYSYTTYFGNDQNVQAYPEYTQNMSYCWGFDTPSLTWIYRYSYVFVAASYEYLDEIIPSHKVKSYIIIEIQREIAIDEYGQTQATNYTIVGYNPIYIPLAEINAEYSTNYYIDEIVIDPEQPFDPSEPDPYPNTPPTPDSSDLISIPGNPTIGVTNAGFINVYKPSIGALQGLGDIIFPNVASATDIVDAVIKLCETIANSNLINYVIDCHVIPVTPQTGTNSNIKVGFRDTGISVPKVTNDYIDVTCGSLNIPEFFHGFQDYASTRSKLYLPFIGFVDTKPEYWQAGTISVDYKFNVIDGSFMCYVRSVSSKSALNGSVIAQYAGNACMHFPLTGVNYANMVSGLVGAAVSAASGGTSSAVLGSALSAANTIAQGGDVQQSNAYNSTAALLGVRTPYLLIERPVAAYPATYAHSKGYPSNIATLLSNVTGFTIIEDIDLSGIPLTQGELEELRGLLKEGVYF